MTTKYREYRQVTNQPPFLPYSGTARLGEGGWGTHVVVQDNVVGKAVPALKGGVYIGDYKGASWKGTSMKCSQMGMAVCSAQINDKSM